MVCALCAHNRMTPANYDIVYPCNAYLLSTVFVFIHASLFVCAIMVFIAAASVAFQTVLPIGVGIENLKTRKCHISNYQKSFLTFTFIKSNFSEIISSLSMSFSVSLLLFASFGPLTERKFSVRLQEICLFYQRMHCVVFNGYFHKE